MILAADLDKYTPDDFRRMHREAKLSQPWLKHSHAAPLLDSTDRLRIGPGGEYMDMDGFYDNGPGVYIEPGDE